MSKAAETLADFIRERRLTYDDAMHASPFEHLLEYEQWRRQLRDRASHRVEIYQSDNDSKFYWQVTDTRNGLIVGASSQGYADIRDCTHNLRTVTGWEADVILGPKRRSGSFKAVRDDD